MLRLRGIIGQEIRVVGKGHGFAADFMPVSYCTLGDGVHIRRQ